MRLVSSDEVEFELDARYVVLSRMITLFVEHGDDDAVVPLQMKSSVLERVVDYLVYHEGKEPAQIQKPLRSADLLRCGVCEWDARFVDVDHETLFNLVVG